MYKFYTSESLYLSLSIYIYVYIYIYIRISPFLCLLLPIASQFVRSFVLWFVDWSVGLVEIELYFAS